MAPGVQGEQALGRIEAQRPVAATHRRQQQVVDELEECLAEVCLAKKQSDPVQEAAGNRLVITLGVVVHTADALVEAANDPRELRVEIDVSPTSEQVGGRTE